MNNFVDLINIKSNISDFYSNHSLKETSIQFNISVRKLTQFLKDNGMLRTKEENNLFYTREVHRYMQQ